MDEIASEGLKRGQIVQPEKGVASLSPDIPHSLAKQLSKILNLGDIYAMGISRNGTLYGSINIFLPKGKKLQDKAIIEAFTRQAAVTIQRRIAEEKLVRHLQELEETVDKRTARINKINEELKESNDLKTLLLDILTHDIKNPAGVVSGVTDLLKEGFDEDLYSLLKTGSDELLNVLENVSNLATVTIGDKIKREEIDLVKITKRIILSFDKLMNEKNIELHISCPESITLMANPVISAIINNYLSNAIRYSLDIKKIDIELGEDEKNIWCNVKDYGTLIPENKRKEIFNRNIRLDNNRRGGKGLGLAIVKRIADAHGAIVGVKPNTPIGNIFFVQFSKD
ncbi:MAG: HAMP domain-containing histidine kinase [Candidatus Marinimicrobia bacterium]|nr:HAMP domain-containing histidine kinase [Candidatus Neomarinimicrobiota bacterium]